MSNTLDTYSFELENDIGLKINGIATARQSGAKLPVVIFIHGFKGFKDWGCIPYVCQKLALCNAIAIRFDFSMNGIADPERGMFDAAVFAKNTITRQIKDFETLVNSLKKQSIIGIERLYDQWNGELYLLGHSLGGAIATMYSTNHNWVNKIALWASIATFRRYTDRQRLEWRKNKILDFTNTHTGQKLWLDVAYLDDIEQNTDELSILEAISNIKQDLLILHGKVDISVPLKESGQLYDASDKNRTQLFIIPHAGHTFGIDHPFSAPTKELDLAISKTIEFFGLK